MGVFPIDEQSSSSDPNGATPAALVPSVPDKQQQQQTGATETDMCEQTSGQVISDSPATSAKDNVTEHKTLPNETGEETSSQYRFKTLPFFSDIFGIATAFYIDLYFFICIHCLGFDPFPNKPFITFPLHS